MRKLDVDGVEFEWLVGYSFLRVRGNGHVVDLPLGKFLEEECGKTKAESYDMMEGQERPFGIEPSDVVTYVRKHGWLTPKPTNKRRSP